MFVKSSNVPSIDNSIDAMLCWFDSEPLDMNKKYLLKHTTNMTKATISEFKYIIDVNTLHKTSKRVMEENDIGRFTTHRFFHSFHSEISRSMMHGRRAEMLAYCANFVIQYTVYERRSTIKSEMARRRRHKHQ